MATPTKRFALSGLGAALLICFSLFAQPFSGWAQISKTDTNSMAALKSAYEKNPKDIASALKYGDALIKGNRIAEAKSLFEAIQPSARTEADQAEIAFQLGYIALREKRYDDALARWKTIMDRFPKTERYSSALVDTAAIRYQIKDELDPPLALLTLAIREKRILAKDLPTAYKLMFMISYDKKDYELAKAVLQKHPEIEAKNFLRDSIWVTYFNTGETAKGEKILADFLAKIWDDYFALYHLATVASDAGIKLPEALTWIERSNELSKEAKFYVIDTYAILLWKTGAKPKAISLLEKAIPLCPRPEVRKEMTERLATYKKDSKTP